MVLLFERIGMRKYFRYLIVIVLLVSAIYLIDFKEESTDKINNDEMVAIKLDDNKTNEPLLKLGKETVYDGLTRDELILRLNNNLYDMVKYLDIKDYIFVYVICFVMSILISFRYSRKLFNSSAMKTYREEAE